MAGPKVSGESGDVSEQDNVTRAELEGFIKEFEGAKREAQNIKKDTMAVFGIFAALLVFVSLEIQIVKNISRFSLMIGFSSFFLASMLLFVLGVHAIAEAEDQKYDLKGAIFKLLWVFLAIAFVCFAYAFLCPPGWGMRWST